jgi:hypothetical protein
MTTAVGWVEAAFRSAGADPRIGPHLTSLLRDAGVRDVTSFGVQAYLGPEDGRGPARDVAAASGVRSTPAP